MLRRRPPTLSPSARAPRGRRRGVALLLVLIVLLLIATLASEVAITARTQYELAQTAMDDFLLESAVRSRRTVLIASLQFDAARGDGIDTETDDWSYKNSKVLSTQPYLPVPDADTENSSESGLVRHYTNRDIPITAWCEDERSKINLRGLLRPADDPLHRFTREALVRLIDVYRDQWNSLDVTDSEASEMVTDLEEWLAEAADTEDNPMPATKPNRGRLLTVDDLLRVPGGKWTMELLYDVRDPDEAAQGDLERTIDPGAAEEAAGSQSGEDATRVRQNGVPGLCNFLTVWAETTVADPPIKININTARKEVLRALFSSDDEELADGIIAKRNEAPVICDESEPEEGAAGGGAADGDAKGWFKSKDGLKEVDGIGQDLTKYPRLDFFADVKSNVFSLRIVATRVSATLEGEEDDGPKEILADLQTREVVERTTGGTLSLYAERRRDPRLGPKE
ncbi:MAG: hypothetical protein HMLKMBBP_01763 [Planctomycetes bacterium]|nr:hypothetical protein [Planctomycetota bacterium]